jgi:hypothetical protein
MPVYPGAPILHRIPLRQRDISRCALLLPESAAPLGAVTAHDVLSPLVPGRSGPGGSNVVPCVSQRWPA